MLADDVEFINEVHEVNDIVEVTVDFGASKVCGQRKRKESAELRKR